MRATRCTRELWLWLPVAALLAATLPAQGHEPPSAETAGNNLSVPVIWADGVTKALRGAPGAVNLGDEWWYWWGTDAADNPLSCAPDPDNELYCDDGIPGVATGVLPGDGVSQVYQVFMQQRVGNDWQAGNQNPPQGNEVFVDLIDWGDNLESINWTLNSQVRVEVVLIEDFTNPPDSMLEPAPMTEYGMRHLRGWGIDEMHGLATLDGTAATAEVLVNTQATVYSHCARLTIQRLLVDREDQKLKHLTWIPGEGWYAPGLVNPAIFNGAVWEGGDGPGYYSAEINVKGKVIYGYTWNVRRLNDGEGDYRITFSLDHDGGPVALLTHFVEGVTEIVPPSEGEENEEPTTSTGAVGVVDFANNLTFIDVRITSGRGGGGGGGHGGGGGGGGKGGGGKGGAAPSAPSTPTPTPVPVPVPSSGVRYRSVGK